MVSHQPKLNIGIEGIFFCRQLNTPGYVLVGGEMGYIRYHYESFNPPASDKQKRYINVKKEIWEEITLQARQPIKVLNPNTLEEKMNNFSQMVASTSSGYGIHFSFENVSITNDLQTIMFDVYAKSSENGVKFGKANIYLTFNSEVFGENLVSNDNIEVTKGTIIQNSAYTLTSSDQTSTMLKVEVSSSSLSGLSAYTLTTVPEQFCHVELSIENFFALANISFNDFQMSGNSWYYDPQSLNYVLFDRVTSDHPIKNLEGNNTTLIDYLFEDVFISESGGNSFLEFDIYAYSNVATSRLSVADIYVHYSPDGFGTLADYTATLAETLDTLGYNIVTLINNSDPFAIRAIISQEDLNDSTKHFQLPTTPVKILHLKLKIQDCSQQADISFVDTSMANSQYYYVGSPIPLANYFFGETSLTDVYNQYLCIDEIPIITDIEPLELHAGISEILTIKGKNLRKTTNSSFNPFVCFRDSQFPDSHPNAPIFTDALPNDIIISNDTLIRMYVPSILTNGYGAASGKIKVKNALNKTAESDESITIVYSVTNIIGDDGYAKRLYLVGADTLNGGYTWKMDEDIINVGVDGCIIQALKEWTCSTGINWRLDTISGTGGVDSASINGASNIGYGYLPGFGDSAYAVTYAAIQAKSCDNGTSIQYFVDEIDIIFNDLYNFQYDCSVFDTSGGIIDFYHTTGHF